MSDFTPSLEHLDSLDKQFIPDDDHLDKLDKMSSSGELTGIPGVAADIGDLFTKALTGIPKTLNESGEYIEENPASSMLHNLGQAVAGVGDLAKGSFNFPAEATDYLLKKNLHPAQLFSGLLQKNTEVGSNEEIAQSLGKNVQRSFHRQLADQLIKQVQKFIPKIGDTGVEEKLGLQPTPGTGDELFRAAPSLALLPSSGKELIKGALQGGKKVNQLLNKPSSLLKDAQETENALKRSFEEAKTGTADTQLKAAEDLSKQKSNLLETHQEKAAEVESLIPNEPESVIKAQTVNHMSDVRQNLKNHFDQEYNAYREGPGTNPIKEPLTPEELQPAFSALNPNGKSMAEGLIPQQVEMNIINPETNEPFVLNVPAANGTVQDYIEMMRTARDAKSKLKRDMGKPSVTRADELQMSREAKALDALQTSVENKIKASVTPEEWQQFQTIQADYKDLYRPFMDNSHLFDAWFHKRDSGQIFKELTQPQYARLFNSLHDDPAFNQLALSQALRGKNHPLEETNPVTQAKKINKLLAPHNADVTRYLSPQQFDSLKSLVTYGNLIGDADKALKSLSGSLLNKATKAHELSRATKLNPQAEKLLSDIQSRQLSQKEIDRRLKEAGINTAEKQSAFEARTNANQMLKKALTLGSGVKILKGF